MDIKADPSASERYTPEGIFALLQAQASQALELKERSEAMAERWHSDPSRKRFLVGLISEILPFPDLLHPIFKGVLLGIRGRLTANDCDLLFCATPPLGASDESRRAAALRTIDRGIDGIIAWCIPTDDPVFEPIFNSGLPSMFIENDVLGKRTGSVTSSDVEGMASAVNHLYTTGRRRIAHITGNFETRPGPDRLIGFRSEIERLGLPAMPEYIQEGDFLHESGYAAMKRLLSLPEPPDAVACACDAIAVGAMAAIVEDGLLVPKDIAVTGYDDAEYAVLLEPSLTTVRQDALGMGAAAAEAVLRMLEDPTLSPPVAVIPTELVVRESSRAARAS
ncbi:MAG: substrate-binding domain-containing protein [Gaiellaceae bacterium]|jgi:DNA-binding LacI/PurR family transcriptional regulator